MPPLTGGIFVFHKPLHMNQSLTEEKRLLSLDFMRGLIMVLLMLESANLFHNAYELTRETLVGNVFIQFFHHPWNGLRFWDLIQPGFMFIAGTAMAYSLHKQWQKGVSWDQSFIKALKRSGWLFFWGVLDYAVRPAGLSFELWDVLTQLSVTMLIAFLIFQWSYTAQLIFSIGLLVLTEILYRFTNIPSFDQPFTDQHNFGNFMDLVLMNKINGDGWVAINCIPTAAHTIWGALAGKLLLSDTESKQKIIKLLLFGAICLMVGYALDTLDITPIIKRIATSSFTLASGGWCLLGLSLCYWWIDVKDHHRYIRFFTIVGMNSIFIYLFFEIVGGRWFNGYVSALTNGLMDLAGVPHAPMGIITSLCIFALEWSMCYFLYRKKIFFKL
jgi:predicted acyltransferase